MDSKGPVRGKFVKKVKKSRTKKNAWSTIWIHRAPTDSMQLMTSWDFGLLTASTAGIISTTKSPSFATYATEFSAVSSLFSEIKLLRAVLVVNAINPRSATNIHGKATIGWTPTFNVTTASAPATIASVINLSGYRYLETARVQHYEIPAYTNNHVWAAISSTNPAVDAGDCGSWFVYSDVLTNNANYFSCQAHCLYAFKGRI